MDVNHIQCRPNNPELTKLERELSDIKVDFNRLLDMVKTREQQTTDKEPQSQLNGKSQSRDNDDCSVL